MEKKKRKPFGCWMIRFPQRGMPSVPMISIYCRWKIKTVGINGAHLSLPVLFKRARHFTRSKSSSNQRSGPLRIYQKLSHQKRASINKKKERWGLIVSRWWHDPLFFRRRRFFFLPLYILLLMAFCSCLVGYNWCCCYISLVAAFLFVRCDRRSAPGTDTWRSSGRATVTSYSQAAKEGGRRQTT